MDLTLLDKFEVGNIVMVADGSPNARFEGFNTYALRGCVQKKDSRAGLCVQLFVSRIFQPCFWYQPGCLAIDNVLMAFVPVPWSSIEQAIGVPSRVELPKNSIILGCLRSWFVSKAQARPGQSLFVFISKMSWEDCVAIYQGGPAMMDAWLKANDTRVRRPQLMESQEDAFGLKGPLSAKRPKIGG